MWDRLSGDGERRRRDAGGVGALAASTSEADVPPRSRVGRQVVVYLGAAIVAALLHSTIVAGPASGQTGILFLLLDPQLASPVTVGDTGVAGTISVAHPVLPGPLPIAVTRIVLWPSCGDRLAPCRSPDPGVFALSATAEGTRVASLGIPFVLGAPDATGMVEVTSARTVVLEAVGTRSVCTIGFSFDVRRAPTIDARVFPGLQASAVAVVQGTATKGPLTVSGSGAGASAVTVNRRRPRLVTHASGPVVVGGALSDSATLSGGLSPTGTVTFDLFGPSDEVSISGGATAAPWLRIGARLSRGHC